MRAIVIFPYVIPTVVAVILWKWLLNSQFGLINYLLEAAGPRRRADQLDGPRLDHGLADHRQRLAVLPVRGDRRAGAAAVHPERALRRRRGRRRGRRWQRFCHVTLPQLKSVLFVIVLLRSIWMFTKFDTPWLMIQGGGAETYIRTLPVYTYMRTFAYYEAGMGAAMAILMFLMLARREPRSISASCAREESL